MKRQPIFVPRLKLPNNPNAFYGYIYITVNSINHRMYIGQHKPGTEGNYKGSGIILLKAFEKYGKENFISEPIDWAESKEELDRKEIWWIDFLGAVDSRDWYNISEGGGAIVPMFGEDNPNYGKHWKQPEEVKEKIRKAAQNNPNYGMKGKKHTEESKRKMRENHADYSGSNHPMYGVHRYGKDNPNYGNHKLAGKNHFRAKAVAQLTLDTHELVRKYDYLKQVVEFGFSEEDVRACCKHHKTQYRGYCWVYWDEYNIIP